MAGATDIYDIILRQESETNFITAGTFLTLKEGDDNLIKIGNWLIEMLAAVDVAAYVGATTYTLGDTVTHGGKYWDYINLVDQSGIEPGTNDTVWILLTVGGLLHKKNEDTQLINSSGQVITADTLTTIAGLVFDTGLNGGAGEGGVGYIPLVVSPGVGTVVDSLTLASENLTPDTGVPLMSLVLFDGISPDIELTGTIAADYLNDEGKITESCIYSAIQTGYEIRLKIEGANISGNLKIVIKYLPAE